jgi:hypothetical protein
MSNVAAFPASPKTIDVSQLEKDDIVDKIEDFIGDEIARLTKQADELQRRAFDLEDIKLDDTRMQRRLKLEKAPLTISHIETLWMEVTEPDRAAEERERTLRQKSWTKSSALRYFTVTNAQNNVIHILADDAGVARYIAHSIGRIKDRTNGHVRAYDTVSIEKLAYGAAIEEALAAGWPGVIEIMQTKVVHPSQKLVFG